MRFEQLTGAKKRAIKNYYIKTGCSIRELAQRYEITPRIANICAEEALIEGTQAIIMGK